jgi:hypothetical protein
MKIRSFNLTPANYLSGNQDKENMASSRLTLSRKTLHSYEKDEGPSGNWKRNPSDSHLTERRKFKNQNEEFQ